MLAPACWLSASAFAECVAFVAGPERPVGACHSDKSAKGAGRESISSVEGGASDSPVIEIVTLRVLDFDGSFDAVLRRNGLAEFALAFNQLPRIQCDELNLAPGTVGPLKPSATVHLPSSSWGNAGCSETESRRTAQSYSIAHHASVIAHDGRPPFLSHDDLERCRTATSSNNRREKRRSTASVKRATLSTSQHSFSWPGADRNIQAVNERPSEIDEIEMRKAVGRLPEGLLQRAGRSVQIPAGTTGSDRSLRTNYSMKTDPSRC